jgi:hypothetical protein
MTLEQLLKEQRREDLRECARHGEMHEMHGETHACVYVQGGAQV